MLTKQDIFRLTLVVRPLQQAGSLYYFFFISVCFFSRSHTHTYAHTEWCIINSMFHVHKATYFIQAPVKLFSCTNYINFQLFILRCFFAAAVVVVATASSSVLYSNSSRANCHFDTTTMYPVLEAHPQQAESIICTCKM